MAKTILLCENSSQAQGTFDMVVYWASFESAANTFSIPEIVDKKAEFFKEKYFSWLYELGNVLIAGHRIIEHLEIREDFSFWWMSLMVEKSQWKSPGLYQIFRLFALEILIQQHKITKVNISIGDKAIQKVVKQWCQEAGIDVEIKRVLKPCRPLNLRRLFNLLPFTLQAIVSLLNYLLLRWPIRDAHYREKQNGDSNGITFISYLFNFDQDTAKKGEFYSRYWTDLHNLLSDSKNTINWLHLFLKSDAVPDSKKARDLVNGFNAKTSSNQIHNLLDSNLGWILVKKVLKDYFRIWRASYRLGKVHHFFKTSNSKMNFWPVLVTDWKSSLFGVTAISNCLSLNLFETFFNQMPHQEKGFYLLENQSWERSLIYAWQKVGHGQLIGVQHTTVSSLDLRHFFSPFEYSGYDRFKLPIPDKVALNGDAAKKAYQKAGFPEDRILEVEALRYLYLDSQSHVQQASRDVQKKRLLILGDYLSEVTNRQMKFLSDAVQDLPIDIEILVKAHPACPINPEDWPSINLRIANNSLDLLTNEYDIAFTSNATAAAVDAYLAGKFVLTMVEPDSFNMSPLIGYPGVQFVGTSDELISCLSGDMLQPNQPDNHFFYFDQELSKWKTLLHLY